MKKTKPPPTPEATATAFAKFAAAGYASAKFTEPLYNRLSRSFGFIAHYNRAGFYVARFADAGARVDTLTIMSDLTEWFSKQPLETLLRTVVEKHGLLGAAIRERDTEIERVERAELARLKAKYEKVDPFVMKSRSEGEVVSLNDDPVMHAGLRLMGDLIAAETGPDVGFAIFVDWHDGRPPSYLSNLERPSAVAALSEWLARTGRQEPTLATERGAVPAIETKCAAICKAMVEEDIDVAIFLFTSGPGGETTWFSSSPAGRSVVEQFVARERARS